MTVGAADSSGYSEDFYGTTATRMPLYDPGFEDKCVCLLLSLKSLDTVIQKPNHKAFK